MNSVKNYHCRRFQHGQSTVEFALSIPFILLILFSILYFGRYFLIAQTLLHAAQQGAKVACRTPNLNNDDIRSMVRGFTTGGSQADTNSVIYATLASANLLSKGKSGDMPPGSKVEILPWDTDGTTADTTPPGTVTVRIDYPFQLISNPFNSGPPRTIAVAMAFNGQGTPVQFLNFTISQRAAAAEEIYQQ